jgi:hypothetical protein
MRPFPPRRPKPEPFDEARHPILGTNNGFHEYKSGELVQVKGKGERIFQIKNFWKGQHPRRKRRTLTFAYLNPVCLKGGAISQPPGRGLKVELRDLKKVSPLILLAKEAADESPEADK